MKNKVNTKRLVESALLIAIGTVLSLIKIFHLPYGGTITLCSMLPLVLLSFRYGVRWGLFSGIVFGILQMFIGITEDVFKGSDLLSVIGVVLLDYIVAYAVVGLAGFTKKLIKNAPAAMVAGTVAVCVLRYLVHVASGYIFFRSYAEWFFSQEGFTLGQSILASYTGNTLGVVYSVIYNAFYMIPETILTAVAAGLVAGVLKMADRSRA